MNVTAEPRAFHDVFVLGGAGESQGLEQVVEQLLRERGHLSSSDTTETEGHQEIHPITTPILQNLTSHVSPILQARVVETQNTVKATHE